MSTKYFVAHQAKKLPLGLDDPYTQAVLNASLYGTSSSENIVVAAIFAQNHLLDAYYRRAEKGLYYWGLPDMSDNVFPIPNEYEIRNLIKHSYANQVYQTSDIIDVSNNKYILGSEVNIEWLAKAWLCNTTNLDYSDHIVVGLVENMTETDVNGFHHGNTSTDPLKSYVPTKEAGFTNTFVPDRRYRYFKTDYSSNDIESSANYYYKEYKGIYKVIPTGEGESQFYWFTKKTYQRPVPGYFFAKPDPNDIILIYTWKRVGYSKETIYGIYNCTTGSHFPEPTRVMRKTYPIIPLRTEFTWYKDYYGLGIVADMEKQYSKLEIGKLRKLTEIFDGNDGVGDLRDSYIVPGSDLYARGSENIEYSFKYFERMILDKPSAYAFFNNYKDYKAIKIEEDNYKQFLVFKKINRHLFIIMPDDTDPKEYEYEIEFTVEPGMAPETVSPWSVTVIEYEGDNDSGYYTIPNPNFDMLPDYLRALPKESNRVVWLKQYRKSDHALVMKLAIHGLVQAHKIKVGSKTKFSSQIASPDEMDLIRAEQDAFDNEVDYEGGHGVPFVLPLVHTIIKNDVSKKSIRSVLNRGLFLHFYTSKAIHIPWWKEFLADVLEVVNIIMIIVTVITVGLAAMGALAANTLSQFAYQLGMDFVKKAITNVIIKKIGGGNFKFIKIAYDLYKGKYDSLNSELMKELIQDVESMLLSYTIEYLSDKLEEDVNSIGEPLKIEQEPVIMEGAENFTEASTRLPGYEDVKSIIENAGKPPELNPLKFLNNTEERK